MKRALQHVFALLLTACAAAAGTPDHPAGTAGSSTNTTPVTTDVFRQGEAGCHTFRIPSVLVSGRGTLLAFCEARWQAASDSGDIDLVLKRSGDGGRSWQPLETVWNDGANTCGNPCPVLDRDTGVLWLLLTWNRGGDREPDIIAQRSQDSRRVFVSCSTNDGLAWAPPREITREVKLTNWTWYATGPGAGIQIEHGPHRGRLVVPCDHIEAGTRRYFSHVIYSDDHGLTWSLGGSSPRDQVNECEVAELADGRLMLNMRNYDRAKLQRQVAFSADGGRTWTGQRHVREQIEPICQASLRRHSWPAAGRPGVLLFSNPASTKREKLTVRLSRDDGESWPVARLLHSGPAAYSCLAVLPDQAVGCLFEADNYQRIVFARFPLAWIEGQASTSAP